ncbi:MAG: peptidyl-alpha-hydroxyglycine alpha-amidating lyase family protein [Candidatus Neomarinimicrobiota bacterium]|nr:peptidyl-alpha-hydroxyglycine alpha-amidating lyase family protein [Candidatus Neomarinimicrobiota bacterium]
MKIVNLILSFFLLAACEGAGKDYTVVHGWPKLPPGFILGQVAGVEVDSHNHVFIFHRGKNAAYLGSDSEFANIQEPTILMLDNRTGSLLNSFGKDAFLTPHGLTVDSENNVWVTDVQYHQIYKFSHDGDLLMTLGEEKVPGWDGTHFNQPTDVAVAPDGTIYVSDGYGNNRVAVFDSKGKFKFEWGADSEGNGQFNLPHGIARDDDGRIYVADRSNSRVQVFESNGTFVDSWKSEVIGRPWGMAVGGDRTLYVVDGGDPNPMGVQRSRIVRMTLSGTVLGSFGSFGQYDGQMDWPHDVGVDSKGSVYVGDVHFGMRIQKFVK